MKRERILLICIFLTHKILQQNNLSIDLKKFLNFKLKNRKLQSLCSYHYLHQCANIHIRIHIHMLIFISKKVIHPYMNICIHIRILKWYTYPYSHPHHFLKKTYPKTNMYPRLNPKCKYPNPHFSRMQVQISADNPHPYTSLNESAPCKQRIMSIVK